MNFFTMLIKPASSLCNLRCKYCFYEDVSNHRDTKSYGFMTTETVDTLLMRVYEFVKKPSTISFAFQGGEPMLAGIDFFTYFCEKADQLNKDGHKLNYSIQTNGTLIDENYCSIFQQYKFLVGISQDGPREFHDFNRIDGNLQGTFDKTHQAIKLLKKYNIEYNILSVITKQMAKKPTSLFKYYKRIQAKYVQLIPCLKSLDYIPGEDLNQYDLNVYEYGQFLKDIFQLWYEELRNNNYISISQFDNIILMLKGRPPEQCGSNGRCSLQCVVEGDGSVYPCDFYVLDDYKQGNLQANTIQEILTSEGSKAFMDHVIAESDLCKNCKVYKLCGGGCKRYRSFYSEVEGYCPYQDFLYASYNQLIEIATRI